MLLEGDYAFTFLHQNFDITPEGKALLLLKTSVDAGTVVVHNWASELRGRGR